MQFPFLFLSQMARFRYGCLVIRSLVRFLLATAQSQPCPEIVSDCLKQTKGFRRRRFLISFATQPILQNQITRDSGPPMRTLIGISPFHINVSSTGSAHHASVRYWPIAGFDLNGEVYVFAMNVMSKGGGLFPFAISSESIDLLPPDDPERVI